MTGNPSLWRSVALASALLWMPTTQGRAAAAPAQELEGSGVQIYRCQRSGSGFAWQFKAPEATLFDPAGRVAGHHFAGPSWQATDGSTVVGAVIASSQGAAGSIPWLLLRARSHRGAGMFAGVSYIVRSRTKGGIAPAAGCDLDHLGQEARIGYSAAYTLFAR